MKLQDKMLTEGVNRNYERNRENRNRRRRFKGVNVESVQEGVAKSSGGLRRSRIDMPTRNTKSLNNLTLIDKEGDADQGNNDGAGGGGSFTPFSRLLKWYKRVPTLRESPAQTTAGKVLNNDQKLSPTQTQQPGGVARKQGFTGPLGLGEYVNSFGAVFDESDVGNSSPPTQIKSRSLIDISMSNLWGSEEDVDAERDADDAGGESSTEEGEGWEKAPRPSTSTERKPSLLATISRLVPLPPTAPNLVQFMDSPATSVNIYESLETTFFGNSEDRWSTPAFAVTTFTHMQRGDLFSVHCVSDYLAELKLTANWTKNVKHLCESELRKYKSAGKNKHQRLVARQSNSAKAEHETELKDLCADFTAFLDLYNAFATEMNYECRNSPVNAILLAGHNTRLLSMKSLLPVRMSYSVNEGQKTPFYRKFLCETPATAVFGAFCRERDNPIEISAFLHTDCLLLASSRRMPKTSTASCIVSTKSGARCPDSSAPAPTTRRPSGVFEFYAHFPLTFLCVTSPAVTTASTSISVSTSASACVTPSAGSELAGGGVVIKVTPPAVCSSSSGISSSASTEEEMEGGSENGSATSACEEAGPGLKLWWPPSNRCHLVLNETQSANLWRSCLLTAVEQVQSCFINRVLYVKVLNDIAPEKCVHKYLALGPNITAREMKEKVLTAWNMSYQPGEVEVVATADLTRGNLELPLSDEDRPFLLGLYLTSLMGEKVTDEEVDLFAADQTERSFNPRNLVSSLPRDCIPVNFIIRDGSRSLLIRQPRVNMEHDIFEPLKLLVERPKSTFYAEAGRAHRAPHLRGLSQSTHNLCAASAAASNGSGGKGRSHSRLRFPFSRTNLTSGDDNGAEDKDSPSQQFGIFKRLPKEAWPDCRVPMSVMSLFVLVFYEGNLTEGIFRKSVQMSQLQAMIQRVDTNEDPLLVEECTPLCAASILKKYFSEIPGHLLIDEKWDDWCKITAITTDEEIANYAKRMMRELPDINQSLLTFLLFTLAQVRVNQAVNKMSVDALSKVWGPNLLQRPNSEPSWEDSTVCSSIVGCLLGPFTDVYCLGSLEFRQKLSVFFNDIWKQMIPPGDTPIKPLPEGISILELPENKPEEVMQSDSSSASTRSLEPLQAKDKRTLWMHPSLSADEHSEPVGGLKPCAKSPRKASKSFGSQESAVLPPPIPPRNHRKSSSCSPLASNILSVVSVDSDTPPPVPSRTVISSQQQYKKTSLPKDTGVFSGTTVVDRRRSFSRRRNPSFSPIRSCTIEVGGQGHRSFMIGDVCEDYNSLSFPLTDGAVNQSNSKLKAVETTTIFPLQRSTSDVDAHLQNKQIQIRKKSQNPLPGNAANWGRYSFPCNTIGAQRTSSRNHRCETRWTCSLYKESAAPDALSPAPQCLRDPPLSTIPKPVGVRTRPTAIYMKDGECLVLPSAQKISPTPEIPPFVCRRFSSLYEQNKAMAEAGCKNWPFRRSLMSPDQLNSTSGGGTHLSRGSSHASTGSSTSTTLGPS